MRVKRMIIAALWILCVVIASIRIEEMTGARLNICLASLIALSFFLTIEEMFLMGAWALLVVNTEPTPARETFLYILIPLAVLIAHHAFPLRRSLNAIGAAWIAIVVFGVAVNYAFVVASPLFVILDACAGALVAGGVFQSMEWAYHEEHVRQRA